MTSTASICSAPITLSALWSGPTPKNTRHSPRIPSFRKSGKPRASRWKKTAWSWEELLKPHLRSADQPKVAIKVEYQETENYAIHARILRHMGLLEAFAEQVADHYAWPNPLTFVARSCGMANARWRQQVLTFCYELANEFIELYLGYSKLLPAKERDGG